MGRKGWVLTLGLASALLCGIVARVAAEVVVEANPGSTKITIKATFPPSTTPVVLVSSSPPINQCFTQVIPDPDGSFDHVIASGCRQGSKVSSYVIAVGNATAGGRMGTASIADSVFASDSTDIDVTRTTGNVRLTFTNGRNILLADRGKVGDHSQSTIKVLVYPTAVAAGQDPTNSGSTAVFSGTVAVSSPSGTLSTSGGFTNANFTAPTDDGLGGFRSTTVTGLFKDVVVANADSAMVRVIGDPSSVDSVPGSGPVVIGIVALLLLGLGWFALYRNRTATA